jgi:hypothetical protein
MRGAQECEKYGSINFIQCILLQNQAKEFKKKFKMTQNREPPSSCLLWRVPRKKCHFSRHPPCARPDLNHGISGNGGALDQKKPRGNCTTLWTFVRRPGFTLGDESQKNFT